MFFVMTIWAQLSACIILLFFSIYYYYFLLLTHTKRVKSNKRHLDLFEFEIHVEL